MNFEKIIKSLTDWENSKLIIITLIVSFVSLFIFGYINERFIKSKLQVNQRIAENIAQKRVEFISHFQNIGIYQGILDNPSLEFPYKINAINKLSKSIDALIELIPFITGFKDVDNFYPMIGKTAWYIGLLQGNLAGINESIVSYKNSIKYYTDPTFKFDEDQILGNINNTLEWSKKLFGYQSEILLTNLCQLQYYDKYWGSRFCYNGLIVDKIRLFIYNKFEYKKDKLKIDSFTPATYDISTFPR